MNIQMIVVDVLGALAAVYLLRAAIAKANMFLRSASGRSAGGKGGTTCSSCGCGGAKGAKHPAA